MSALTARRETAAKRVDRRLLFPFPDGAYVFTYLRGPLTCLRCGVVSDAAVQTHLFRATAENSCREYRAGDSEVIDGIDDFYPLHPWDERMPLVLGMGEWECGNCSLNWQWTRVVLGVSRRYEELVATVRVVEPLMPWVPASLAGINFVEPELAELSEFPDVVRADRRAWLAEWSAQQVEVRCASIAKGFRAWCLGVAGVSGPGCDNASSGGEMRPM